jgi:hypothetical protein
LKKRFKKHFLIAKAHKQILPCSVWQRKGHFDMILFAPRSFGKRKGGGEIDPNSKITAFLRDFCFLQSLSNLPLCLPVPTPTPFPFPSHLMYARRTSRIQRSRAT